MGTFGATTVRVPRARLATPEGKTAEWRNATVPAYQRRTKQADALIAGAYLSGINTRRVRRALAALFGGAVGKDTVSRVDHVASRSASRKSSTPGRREGRYGA
jgi:transposase-like protein